MTDLAIYEYTKHIIRNIFIAIIMSVLCFLSAIIFSVLRYHYTLFKPFKQLGKEIGTAYFSWSNNEKILSSGAKGLGKQYKVNIAPVFVDDEGAFLYIYDEWIWENWEPRLKSGKWFKSGNSKELPEVVIGGDTKGYKVGDIISIKGLLSADKTGMQDFYVVGVFQDQTKLIGGNSFSLGGEKYNKCYFEAKSAEDKIFYAIVKNSDFKNSSIAGVDVASSIWMIQEFNDADMTKEELEESLNLVRKAVSNTGVTYDVFMDKSRKVFKAQIMLYIPLFVLAIILIGVIIYNLTRIDLRDSSYSHSIYYCLGASKSVCRRISFYTLMINVILSIIMFVGEVLVYARISQNQNINFRLGPDTFIITAIVYAVLVIYTMFVSRLMSRGMTPVDLLRENRTAI